MKFFRSKGWLIGNMIVWSIGVVAQFENNPYTGEPASTGEIVFGIIFCAAIGYWAFHVYRKHYPKTAKPSA